MKKQYIFLLFMILSAIIQTSTAQRIVKISGITPGEPLVYDQIYKAITADAPNRVAGGEVIYELSRGQVYLASSTVDATNYNLNIRAEAGTGPLPLVLHCKTSSGASVPMINSRQHISLENIEFDSQHSDHSYGNRVINFAGKGYRAIIKGCYISNDRGSLLTSTVDNQKIYITDCVLGNSGHFISVGGNGRLIDLRSTASVDSIVIQNCTVYNLTDRMLRNMGPVFNYVKIDHVTLVNCQGFHGCVQLGKTKKAEITNNIFANPMAYGERTGIAWRGEQTSPDKRFAIITHDSLSKNLTSASIVMRNNNIFFDQKFTDFFNQVPATVADTVLYPNEVSSSVKYFLGATLSSAYFKEILQFKNASSAEKILEFTTYYYSHPKASVLPNNFSSLFPYEWNVTYSTTSKSYTAADKGYPLGNLNAWPDLKSRWAQGLSAVKKSLSSSGGIAESVSFTQGFPNPFTDKFQIDYSISENQDVDISIYNCFGQKVSSLVNNSHSIGDYTITWDGTDTNGNNVASGIYFCQIKSKNGRVIKKVIKQ